MSDSDIFKQLENVIASRKEAAAETSYTAKLMNAGVEAINAKIIEEASEVCEAALENDKDHLVYEICDLMFHTLVLAGHKDISLKEISTELTRRLGTSGLTEKANRK